ncbi:GMC oxidoreductase [Hoeflea sp.]|uniref:GMC oxidoreductase n=1 Tax=Hoeflea sp. TaxID=1940281 RepID=UPI003B0160F8
MIVSKLRDAYDLVVVGSGFGSLFFVEAYQRKFPRASIAIVERGDYRSYGWQIQNNRNSAIDINRLHATRRGEKVWNYTIGFGGGLNCWSGQTPRFHPSDFRTKSLYGRGVDWPVSYDELEPFYILAENRMGIAGDMSMSAVLPRSRPFPQPAHRLTRIDQIMRAAQPEMHVPISCARASIADENRSACCSTGRCNLCPVNAKFSVDSGFRGMIEDPGVDILLNAEVRTIDHANGAASGIGYRREGVDGAVSGDLIVLGANGIHSPAILLRSGISDHWVGRGLHEQHSVYQEIYLDGVENFDGGSYTTALNYSLYDGPHRKDYAGTLVYFENRWPFGLRPEKNKWRMTLPLWLSIEDLPSPEHRVVLDDNDNPLIEHPHVSDYALTGTRKAVEKLPQMLAPLPVEDIIDRGVVGTASHIQGSVRMGQSQEDSVVDRGLLHHSIRNLMIVGTGVIPTSSAANPSLTAAALSLHAADLL